MEQNQEVIRDLLNAYAAALNNSDAAGLAALYCEDGHFMPDGLPTLRGADKVFSNAQKFFQRRTVQAGFSIVDVHLDHDYAIVESVATMGIHDFTGHSTSMETRDLFVMKRQESSWKIARYIFNTL